MTVENRATFTGKMVLSVGLGIIFLGEGISEWVGNRPKSKLYKAVSASVILGEVVTSTGAALVLLGSNSEALRPLLASVKSIIERYDPATSLVAIFDEIAVNAP